jgi:TrmH family RNA methyltransferase
MITSLANPKIKAARALHQRKARYRERQFLIEGVRLTEDALRAGIVPALVFYTVAMTESERCAALLESLRAAGAPVEEVSEALMPAITDTVTPQGIAAIVPFVERPPSPDSDLVLVVDGLSDPGNLGTLLRTAEAAGLGQVILAPRTVDVYSPKVVRAAMGAHFHLALTVARTWADVAGALAGFPTWVADVQAAFPYYAVDWTGRAALIVGSEAHGPGDDARRLATGTVGIPMPGPAESLNAAVAAAIILFEALRQRATAREK